MISLIYRTRAQVQPTPNFDLLTKYKSPFRGFRGITGDVYLPLKTAAQIFTLNMISLIYRTRAQVQPTPNFDLLTKYKSPFRGFRGITGDGYRR